MKVICDIETNRLFDPDHVWVIVCRNVHTDEITVFENVTLDEKEKERFISFARQVTQWIGHNFISFDLIHINNLVCPGLIDYRNVVDTLVLSKLLHYSREGGHSLESYGEEFGIHKVLHVDYSKNNSLLKERCIGDTSINQLLFNSLSKYLSSTIWKESILLEHHMAYLCNTLSTNGFYLNSNRGRELLAQIEDQLSVLDKDILGSFLPKAKLVREINPTLTKHGTLHKKDFKWVKDGDLTPFNGGPFCLIKWEEFNPASPKQVVRVLNEAGWKPSDKTKGYIELEREVRRKQRSARGTNRPLDISLQKDYSKLVEYEKVGWKVNETNLATLPSSAPSSAKTLAKRILLESRRRTLVEWLGLADPQTSRVHGRFQHIGAWTHRMSHQNPNTANIPRDKNDDGTVKLYGEEFRSLWGVPKDNLLIGVDAEGIQLRVLAHYIEDEEFTNALINGDSEKGTDPHSLNKTIIGDVCKTRQAAKRFIYALVLGAGYDKLAEVLSATRADAEEAVNRMMERYQGWAELKKTQIAYDAKRGYFQGFDGRFVRVPGEGASDRRHLMISGYLQNGEAIIMKKACIHWHNRLTVERVPFKFVNFVHDEWQTETINDMDVAKYIANVQAESIKLAGEELKLKCPMAGSVRSSKDKRKLAIGFNWNETH